MTRYKGQLKASRIEREYPHHVDMIVPPGGLGKRLDAMYDWYARERSPLAARAWAAVNLLATLTKLGVVVAVHPEDRAHSGTRRERYRAMRRAARVHLHKLMHGTRLGASAGERHVSG